MGGRESKIDKKDEEDAEKWDDDKEEKGCVWIWGIGRCIFFFFVEFRMLYRS